MSEVGALGDAGAVVDLREDLELVEPAGFDQGTGCRLPTRACVPRG